MIKTLLAFLLLALIGCKSFAQPYNYSITTLPFLGAGEPYLAVNPANPNNMIIAWMEVTTYTPAVTLAIKTATTSNGGSSWAPTHTFTHTAAGWTSADVSIAFKSNGTAYISFIDYKKTPSDTGYIYINKSYDGGNTWSYVSKAWVSNEDWHMEAIDRPWLVIDNSNSVNKGTLYLTTKPVPWKAGTNHHPYLKFSSDSGQTWSAYKYIDAAAGYTANVNQPMAAVCVAADGALCMAYPSFFGHMYFAKSFNKGSTIVYDTVIKNAPFVINDTLAKLGHNIAANPLKANQLACSFVGDSASGNDHNIYVTVSSDGGTTWRKLRRVNDDNSGKDQDMAWVSFSDNNKLVAVWRDRRNAPGTGYKQPTEIFCSVSLDSGATFLPNVKLSNIAAPHYTVLEQSGNDFLSCDFRNDTIYAAWGDTRTGKLNIYFTKTSVMTGLGLAPVAVNTSSFGIYPNPASDKLFIKSGSEEWETCSIYDASGQNVLSVKNVNGMQGISLKKLSPGMYFVTLEKKGIIQHSDRIVIRE